MPKNYKRKIIIQEELERRILHGLACEWENALWILESADREKLSRPAFSIRNMNGRYGFWSGERNEICLSRDLVLNHPWTVVREILVHEMAHQFAEQALGADEESPHGPKFRYACYLLRANPKASGTYRFLDERISHDSPTKEDRIMLRVKKLMALAQSRNQHEAEAAMAKAHEFIAKYNIDLLARNEDRNFVSTHLGTPALRHFREEYHLSNLLQEFYFVHVIWVSAYVLEKGKMGNALEITGTEQNVKIAGYVHDYVKHFIDSQWDKYNTDKGLNRYRKTDFAVGVMEGFRSKLELQTGRQKKPGVGRKLIVLSDPLLQKHIKYRYPHTTSLRGKALRRDRKILNDGMSVGRELVISRGITERKKGGRLLIGEGR